MFGVAEILVGTNGRERVAKEQRGEEREKKWSCNQKLTKVYLKIKHAMLCCIKQIHSLVLHRLCIVRVCVYVYSETGFALTWCSM